MKNKFRTIFEPLPSAAVLVDEQGGIVAVNNAFCSITGYDSSVENRLNMAQLFYWESAQKGEEIMKCLLQPHSPVLFELEVQLQLPNQSTLWAHLNVKMLHDQEADCYFGILILLDLSEFKRLQQSFQRIFRDTSLSNC